MQENQKKVLVIGSVILVGLILFQFKEDESVLPNKLDDNKPKSPTPIVFMLMRETNNEANISKEVASSFGSRKLREYLQTHTYKLADVEGRPNYSFRIEDNDESFENDDPVFRDFAQTEQFKNASDENCPYFFLSNGKEGKAGDGIEGRWDFDAEEGVAFLKTWGGE